MREEEAADGVERWSMGERTKRDGGVGRGKAILTVGQPFLLGNGMLITFVLNNGDVNISSKLLLGFAVAWNLIAVIRAFQLGRFWHKPPRVLISSGEGRSSAQDCSAWPPIEEGI